MVNYDIQNASKLKKDLPTELGSYVAVYKDMTELNKDINKYNNINYAIIFVGTCAYIIKKEDYNGNQFDLGISNDQLSVSTSIITNIPKPVLTNVKQNELVIPDGILSYLNNYTGIK